MYIKKRLVIFLFVLFSHTVFANLSQGEVGTLLSGFFNALASGNDAELKKSFSTNTVIKNYTKEEMKNYIDQLIMGDIDEIHYLKKVTSRNLYRFLNSFDNVIWKIDGKPEYNASEIYTDKVEIDGSVLNYYYVNFSVHINILNEQTQNIEKKIHKNGSIYFKKENGKLLLFGLII